MEFTAKFPVMELLPGKLTAAAWMARFVSVIELPTVPITDPLVRRASEEAPPGVNAAVTFIVPELEPPTSPILTTVADRRSNSASTSDSCPDVSVPRSICRLSVAGLMVTAPEVAETVALRAIVSAFSKTSAEFEVKVPEFDIEVPNICMSPPPVEVWLAFKATAPPITVKFPATEFVPVSVTPAVLPVFPKVKAELLTKDQVGSKV